MKVKDPDQEIYRFPLSALIQQEHVRIRYQAELDALKTKCTESEQRFRVSQFKKYPIRYGMPYQEAKDVMQEEFKPDGQPRAAEGAHQLESNTHRIVFQKGVLVDIVPKHTPTP